MKSDSLSLFSETDVVSFFEFLDNLRTTGVTNMLAASPHLVEEFGLSKEKSGVVLSLWMKTYDREIPVAKRARVAWIANGGTK